MSLKKEYIVEKINKVTEYLFKIRDDVVDGDCGGAESRHKPDASVVTYFDEKIESDIRKILLDSTKGVGLYGEEFGIEGDKETFWTIDPIDGTEQYIRGNPFYTCMIGLVDKGVPTAALIYNYSTNEMFTRLPGEKTKLNGKLVRVSGRSLSRAIVETEIKTDFSKRNHLLGVIRSKVYTEQKIAACAGFGMTQVIKGATEGRIQISGYGRLYDYLPGQVLVDGAGGKAQTPGKNEWDWTDLSSIVTNSVIAKEMKQIIDTALDSKLVS